MGEDNRTQAPSVQPGEPSPPPSPRAIIRSRPGLSRAALRAVATRSLTRTLDIPTRSQNRQRSRVRSRVDHAQPRNPRPLRAWAGTGKGATSASRLRAGESTPDPTHRSGRSSTSSCRKDLPEATLCIAMASSCPAHIVPGHSRDAEVAPFTLLKWHPSRASAARTAQLAQSGFGRATWRRSTITSWRSTAISAALDARLWPSQRKTRIVIKYSRRTDTNRDLAPTHWPGQSAARGRAPSSEAVRGCEASSARRETRRGVRP
jgi:hypothetical protein